MCGCDNINYWNASIAASHGMAVLKTGECTPGRLCGGIGNLMCPARTYCGYHQPNAAACAATDTAGDCWAIPATCPMIIIGPRTRACGAASCADECGLIRSQTPYYSDNTCPQ